MSTENPYDDITAAEPAVLENVSLSDLHIQGLLCSGSYAKTYRGVFNGQACAVKRTGELTVTVSLYSLFATILRCSSIRLNMYMYVFLYTEKSNDIRWLTAQTKALFSFGRHKNVIRILACNFART